MKILLTTIAMFLGNAIFAQNPNYNEVLAKELKADEYGMRSYYLVMLKTGSNTNSDKSYKDSCFKLHFTNMETMEKAGKLIVAGPLSKNDKTYRGIFILSCDSVAEVKQLLSGDGAVNSGLLEAEIYKWYGSAALPLYLKNTDKLWRKKM